MLYHCGSYHSQYVGQNIFPRSSSSVTHCYLMCCFSKNAQHWDKSKGLFFNLLMDDAKSQVLLIVSSFRLQSIISSWFSFNHTCVTSEFLCVFKSTSTCICMQVCVCMCICVGTCIQACMCKAEDIPVCHSSDVVYVFLRTGL